MRSFSHPSGEPGTNDGITMESRSQDGCSYVGVFLGIGRSAVLVPSGSRCCFCTKSSLSLLATYGRNK